MSTVSSPVNFNDLKAASVYYEILDCDPTNLQAICPEEQFEKRPDGTLSYYNATANGSYVHASGNRGEFVKMTRSDGREVFLHYSQVFGPTLAARRRMGILAQALGAAYQSTNRQMAMLNDLITEAAALNESMRKFNDVYYSFAANAVNYDSGLPSQMLQINPELLQVYIDNGLQLPLNRVCSGSIPQLYVRISDASQSSDPHLYVKWAIFFVENIGGDSNERVLWEETKDYGTQSSLESLDPPQHTLSECLGDAIIKALMDDPEKMRQQFSASGKHELTSYITQYDADPRGAFYLKCSFNSDGDMLYNYLFGYKDNGKDLNLKSINLLSDSPTIASSYEVEASASGYSYTVPPEQVLDGSKTGYFSQREVNALLDQIRIAIDQLNNKLSGLSTVIGVYNQDLQQNYTVATSALEATEEAHQKTTRNIR